MGSGGKSGGDNKTFDYYGSIAGELCSERLDFIWGVLKDDKIIWPQTLPWVQWNWPAGSCVVYGGRIYETPSATTAVPPAAPWVLFKRERANTPNPFKFTIPNMGEAFLYWGTPTQTLDVADEKFLAAHGHPPYRWRSVLALKNCLFGTEVQTAPNITVLGGRAPQQSLIVGPAALLDADWQANPWCVIAELLTHPVIGYGWPLSRFHQPSWQAAADACRACSTLTYISPFYDSQSSLRSIVSDLLSYVDGFIFWNADGQLQAGHWPHNEAPPAFGPSNTLGTNEITGEVQWETESFNGTSSAVVVNFQDIAAGFNTVPAHAANILNRLASGRAQSRTVDRPFIVRSIQAAALASEQAKIGGEPFFKGTLPVRAEKTTAIAPGGLFALSDVALGANFTGRCLSKTIGAPPSGVVKLGFESERGLSEQPYQATPADPGPSGQLTPARFTNFQLVNAPIFGNANDHQLACLVARNNSVTVAAELWWRQAEQDEAFESLATLSSFAVAGTMNASIHSPDVVSSLVTNSSASGTTYSLPHQDVWNLTLQSRPTSQGAWQTRTAGADYLLNAETGKITIVSGGAIANGSQVEVSYSRFVHIAFASETPLPDFESISAPLTADEVNNNTLLLFAFNASDASRFEIMSAKSIEAAGGGFYRAQVRRSRFGTLSGGDGSHVWNAPDRFFIAFRSALVPVAHESFATLSRTEQSAMFRLVPATASFEAEVEDVFGAGNNPDGLTTEFEYSFRNPYAPKLTWTSLLRNGTEISDFNAMFAQTDQFQFTFRITDAIGDLVQATLTARMGNVDRTLWSQTLVPDFDVLKSAQFTIPNPGAWQIVCTVRDAAGNVTETPLAVIGDAEPVPLNIQGSQATAPAPVIYSHIESNGYITNLVFGWMETNLTVLYQVRELNAPTDSGAWVVAPATGTPLRGTMQRYGPVPNFPKNRSLYAKVQKNGFSESAVVRWNF